VSHRTNYSRVGSRHSLQIKSLLKRIQDKLNSGKFINLISNIAENPEPWEDYMRNVPQNLEDIPCTAITGNLSELEKLALVLASHQSVVRTIL